jgi:SapC
MTRHVLLNNVEHRDLRVITRRAPELNDNMMSALTYPAEFREVQTEYPIVFAPQGEGKFAPVALFGLHEKQNLFLQDGKWDALYIPMMVERIPFFIGEAPNGKVIHIDMDSPHISRTEGERVFQDDGSNTPYLNYVSRILGGLDENLGGTKPFVDALLELNLLEGFSIDITFRDGMKRSFGGFNIIQEERFAKLDAAAVGSLHQRGFLQPIYMAIASAGNFRCLVDRANKLEAAAR